jgi:hypothetical protein
VLARANAALLANIKNRMKEFSNQAVARGEPAINYNPQANTNYGNNNIGRTRIALSNEYNAIIGNLLTRYPQGNSRAWHRNMRELQRKRAATLERAKSALVRKMIPGKNKKTHALLVVKKLGLPNAVVASYIRESRGRFA